MFISICLLTIVNISLGCFLRIDLTVRLISLIFSAGYFAVIFFAHLHQGEARFECSDFRFGLTRFHNRIVFMSCSQASVRATVNAPRADVGFSADNLLHPVN